jgi:hypothetical protein
MSPAELRVAADITPQNLPYSMPSQQELTRELLFRNQGTESKLRRVDDSLDFLRAVSRAREVAASGEQINNLILEELLTAGIDFYGNTALFVSEGRDEPDWHSEKSQPFLVQAVNARKNLLDWIGVYTNWFKNEDEKTLYSVLKTVMEDSKRVVSGSESLDPKHEAIVRDHLRGILAEYQVLKTVQSLWPKSIYSSPEDDLYGRKVDILVPFGADETLGLQVKGRAKQRELSASWEKNEEQLLVVVPMGDPENQFKMSQRDSGRLIRKVNARIGILSGLDLAA